MIVFRENKTRIIVKQYFFLLRSVSKTNPHIGVLCYVITRGNMDRIVLCEKQQTDLSDKKTVSRQNQQKENIYSPQHFAHFLPFTLKCSLIHTPVRILTYRNFQLNKKKNHIYR